MSVMLTASDRSSLIRLASSLPAGDRTRRVILAGLKVVGCDCLEEDTVIVEETPVSPLSLRRDYGVEKFSAEWISKAIKEPGRVHEYFGIPEDEPISLSKITAEIDKLRNKEERTEEESSLLRALNLAVTLKGLNK